MEKSIPIATVAIVLSVVAVISGVAGVFISPATTIGAGGVGTNEIADGSVTGEKIADGTITDTDISSTGVSRIADDAVGSGHISDGSIALSDLSSAVVDVITGLENIADNSITSEKIQDGTITDSDIASDAAISPSKVSGTAWTSTNDGSGSGLDADNLDGLSSDQFLRSDIGGSVDGNLAIFGSLLVVDGTIFTDNVETDNVIYSTPHEHYFMIGADGFIPTSTAVFFYNSGGLGGAYTTTDLGALSAPAHLPHGAQVTSFKVFFYDNTANDVSVGLYGLRPAGGGYISLANVDSSGISGYGSKTDTSISSATINNKEYGYCVRAFWENGDSNAKTMGALIMYTTDAAL